MYRARFKSKRDVRRRLSSDEAAQELGGAVGAALVLTLALVAALALVLVAALTLALALTLTSAGSGVASSSVVTTTVAVAVALAATVAVTLALLALLTLTVTRVRVTVTRSRGGSCTGEKSYLSVSQSSQAHSSRVDGKRKETHQRWRSRPRFRSPHQQPGSQQWQQADPSCSAQSAC